MNLSTRSLLVTPSRLVLCAGMFLAIGTTASLADPRCQQLEALHRQYIGVSLTADQKVLKRQLVAWYKANCRMRRAAR